MFALTSKGSISGQLHRALAAKDVLAVRSLAGELPRVPLQTAAEITVLLREREPESYAPAARRLLARLATERAMPLRQLADIAAILAELESDPAMSLGERLILSSEGSVHRRIGSDELATLGAHCGLPGADEAAVEARAADEAVADAVKAAEDEVLTRATVNEVAALAAINDVAAGIAQIHILALAAQQGVAAGGPSQTILTLVAAQGVVAGVAPQLILAVVPLEDVVPTDPISESLPPRPLIVSPAGVPTSWLLPLSPLISAAVAVAQRSSATAVARPMTVRRIGVTALQPTAAPAVWA